MVNCSGYVRAVWPGVGVTTVGCLIVAAAIDDGGWLGAWVAEVGDRLPAICVASSVVLAGVAYCRNFAIKDESCTWSARGKAAFGLVGRLVEGSSPVVLYCSETAGCSGKASSLADGQMPPRIHDGAGADGLILALGEFNELYRRLAITALVPFVIRWRDGRCKRRSSRW